MPKKTEEEVKLAVFEHAVNHPDDGAVVVHKDVAKRFGASAASIRTVGKYLREARKMNPDSRRRYREVHWPGAFGTTDLPWEAAAPVLELARLLSPNPPLMPLAVWYWRASLAFPLAEPRQRWVLAAQLALHEDSPADLQVLGDDATRGTFPEPRIRVGGDMTAMEAVEQLEVLRGAMTDFHRDATSEAIDAMARVRRGGEEQAKDVQSE